MMASIPSLTNSDSYVVSSETLSRAQQQPIELPYSNDVLGPGGDSSTTSQAFSKAERSSITRANTPISENSGSKDSKEGERESPGWNASSWSSVESMEGEEKKTKSLGLETYVSLSAGSANHGEVEEKLFSAAWNEEEEQACWPDTRELRMKARLISRQVITSPFDYIMALPAKNFRTYVLVAFNFWLQVDEESLSVIEKVIAMLHNASLMIDDIQDGSELRRGFPAAHCVFGTAQSINSANYAYFLAQSRLLQLRNSSEAVQIFNEEVLNLHRGQGIELFWRDTLTVPTEDEYFLMISLKTGGLFRLAARLMQALSSTTHNILRLADLVGLIFQVRDDHQNLCSEQMTSAKGFCEDLTEGKFSLPVIHSIRNSPTGNNEILNILKLHTTDVALKVRALSYMETQTNSLEYTKEKLGSLHLNAQSELRQISTDNELMERVLAKLELD